MDSSGRIRGALIDVDGVLHVGGAAIPGAVEALEWLRAHDIRICLFTNGTLRTRADLAGDLRVLGFEVAPEEMITAAAATADYVRRTYSGQPCHLLVSGQAQAEFEDVPLTDSEDEASVVVIGGAGPEFSFEALNRVYRMLRNGAALVAMHKSVHWMTADGITLDSGAFIHGLEWATGTAATVIGKPSPEFFRAGYETLGLPPDDVMIVSDDNVQDVQPGMIFGSTGIVVRTGVYEDAHLEAGQPDALLDSLGGLPGWFQSTRGSESGGPERLR